MRATRKRVVEGLRRRIFGAPRRAGKRDALDLDTRKAAQRHRSFDAMSAILAWMLQLAQREAPSFTLDGRSALEIGSGKFLAQALALHVCGCREVVSVDRFRQVRPDAVREAMSHPVLARRFLSPFVRHDDFMERLSRLRATGYDLERLRKPNPHHVLRICQAFGIDPTDAWLIGDTPTDIETARRAGCRSVGVTWGFRTRRDLEAAGAQHMIDRPDQLVPLLRAAPEPKSVAGVNAHVQT